MIERIFPARGGKAVGLRLEDGRVLYISRPRAERLGLGRHATLPCPLPGELLRLSAERFDLPHAKETACRMLRVPLFSRELYNKLTDRGFSEEIAAATVAWATENKFLQDDELLARRVEAASRQGKGPRRIMEEMASRGIDREETAAALERIESTPEGRDDDDDFQAFPGETAEEYATPSAAGQLTLAESAALRQVERRLRNDTRPDARRRAGDFLARRGFSWDSVRKILEAAGEEEE